MNDKQPTSNRVTKMIMRATAKSRRTKGLMEATQTRKSSLRGFKAFARSARDTAGT